MMVFDQSLVQNEKELDKHRRLSLLLIQLIISTTPYCMTGRILL